MAEELISDKVYKRVNELAAENPGSTNQVFFKQVQEEMGFDKMATVSANYYRAKAKDPSAPPSKRGRPRKNPEAVASSSAAAAPARKPRAAAASGTRRTARGRSAAAAPAADTNQALSAITSLVEENQRLTARNAELEEKFRQIGALVG